MKPAVVLFVTVLALAAIIGTFFALDAYPQDPGYHRFADTSAFFGIGAHGLLVLVLVFYAIAKLCETYDHEIYRHLRVVSGHTLKHLAAAASTAVIWLWLVKRQPRRKA